MSMKIYPWLSVSSVLCGSVFVNLSVPVRVCVTLSPVCHVCLSACDCVCLFLTEGFVLSLMNSTKNIT